MAGTEINISTSDTSYRQLITFSQQPTNYLVVDAVEDAEEAFFCTVTVKRPEVPGFSVTFNLLELIALDAIVNDIRRWRIGSHHRQHTASSEMVRQAFIAKPTPASS